MGTKVSGLVIKREEARTVGGIRTVKYILSPHMISLIMEPRSSGNGNGS